MIFSVCNAAGLLQVLACAQAARKAAPRVHVHGFNWSGKHWMTHQVSTCTHPWHVQITCQTAFQQAVLDDRLNAGVVLMARHQMYHANAQMKAEEEIVRRLAAPFSVEFHPAACAGLRSCDPACDTADYQAADPDACRKR
jgi:hypothetical protein